MEKRVVEKITIRWKPYMWWMYVNDDQTSNTHGNVVGLTEMANRMFPDAEVFVDWESMVKKDFWRLASRTLDELDNLPSSSEDPECILVLANAISKAVEQERESIVNMLEEGYDRVPGKPYRDDGVYSKNDECLHGRYMYQDCEECAIQAIRSRSKS